MTGAAVSVIICAYSTRRWDDLRAAVASVEAQSVAPHELIVVIDHHPELLGRASAEFGRCRVMPNSGPKGLSGARNTGVVAATGGVVAFLDDDATAAPGWLGSLVDAYSDHDVLGVGGWAVPAWDTERPGWFPDEFLWVVGCSYRGLPTERAEVRNLIGCNMSLRADVLEAVGGFDVQLGRTADRPLGCEETELCIRACQLYPAGRFVLEPRAVVHHRVPAERTTWAYFCDRCSSEGVSKAWVTKRVGRDSTLASERTYALRVLPLAVGRSLAATRPRDRSGASRAGAVIAGLGHTAVGYLLERRVLVRSDPATATTTTTATLYPVIVDLAAPIVALSGPDDGDTRALCLVVLRGTKIGHVDMEFDRHLPAAAVAERIWFELSDDVVRVAVAAGIPAPSSVPLAGFDLGGAPTGTIEPRATAVVATRNRALQLERCLASILGGVVVPAQIVVVDNAPSDDQTRQLVERLQLDHPSLRYMREERPGLGRAHNVALGVTDTELVAFTDDDVVAQPWWLARLVDAFDAASDVVCVTGMIAPLELETPAQQLIEATAGFNKGSERRIFGPADTVHGALYPYAAGAFGSGANMAFRTAYLDTAGGFDEALGAGTVALGGDDLAAFYDVISSGHRLVYEPAAIVSHLHHRTIEALERQAYGYGAGLSAHLLRCVMNEPRALVDMLCRAPAGIRRAMSIAHPAPDSTAPEVPPMPTGLAMHHWRGMASGPTRYLRSRRAIRSLDAEPITTRGAA